MAGPWNKYFVKHVWNIYRKIDTYHQAVISIFATTYYKVIEQAQNDESTKFLEIALERTKDMYPKYDYVLDNRIRKKWSKKVS